MAQTPSDKSSNFLTRWSDRKIAAQKNEPGEPTESDKPHSTKLDHAVEVESVKTVQSTTKADSSDDARSDIDRADINQLTDSDMPPLDSLNEDSDYSGFFSQQVSSSLRKQALKKLFSAPAFNITDGLDDYDLDYTGYTPLGDQVTAEMSFRLEQEAQRTAQALAEKVEGESQEIPVSNDQYSTLDKETDKTIQIAESSDTENPSNNDQLESLEPSSSKG